MAVAVRYMYVCVLYAILGFDDARCGLHVVNALVYTQHSVADTPTSNVQTKTSLSAAPINHNHNHNISLEFH